MRNKYQLPHPVRMQVIWMVRDFERMKNEYSALETKSPKPPDGQPRGGNVKDTTADAAIQRAELSSKIQAVERAYSMIPAEYRQGVWDNVVHRARYPSEAGERTYRRHKARFLYRAAKNLRLI